MEWCTSWKSRCKATYGNSDSLVANMFCQYFHVKIEPIHSFFSDSHTTHSPQTTQVSFSCLTDVSADYIKMMLYSPTKSCSLDPMPTFLVKDCIEILALQSPNWSTCVYLKAQCLTPSRGSFSHPLSKIRHFQKTTLKLQTCLGPTFHFQTCCALHL